MIEKKLQNLDSLEVSDEKALYQLFRDYSIRPSNDTIIVTHRKMKMDIGWFEADDFENWIHDMIEFYQTVLFDANKYLEIINNWLSQYKDVPGVFLSEGDKIWIGPNVTVISAMGGLKIMIRVKYDESGELKARWHICPEYDDNSPECGEGYDFSTPLTKEVLDESLQYLLDHIHTRFDAGSVLPGPSCEYSIKDRTLYFD